MSIEFGLGFFFGVVLMVAVDAAFLIGLGLEWRK